MCQNPFKKTNEEEEEKKKEEEEEEEGKEVKAEEERERMRRQRRRRRLVSGFLSHPGPHPFILSCRHVMWPWPEAIQMGPPSPGLLAFKIISKITVSMKFNFFKNTK